MTDQGKVRNYVAEGKWKSLWEDEKCGVLLLLSISGGEGLPASHK